MAEDTSVISPSGQLGTIPAGQVQEAIAKYGYRLPSQQEMAHQALQDKYGGSSLAEFEAGVAGAARGATFGLSDLAATKSGLVNPETLQNLKTFNPGISALTEIGGAVGSSFVLPGGGLVGLAGKGAEEVGAGLAEHMISNQLAKRAVAAGIGSAIEGSAYGAAQNISEEALGDPNLTAQKIWSNIGLGALIGGGIGLTGKALGAAGFSKATSLGEKAEEAIPAIEGTEASVIKEQQKIADQLRPDKPQGFIKPEEVAKVQNNPDAFSYPSAETPNGKLGTEAIPTTDESVSVLPNGKPAVKGSEAFLADIGKLQDVLNQRKTAAEHMLDQSNATMSADELKSIFENRISKNSKEFSIGKDVRAADSAMKDYIDQISTEQERLGRDQLQAPEIKRVLRQIWEDNEAAYTPGKSTTATEKSLKDVAFDINDYLKTKVVGPNGEKIYADLMDPYHKEVEIMKAIKKQIGMARDPETGEMFPKIMNWFQNRVNTPLQRVSVAEGEAASLQSKTLQSFSDVVGRNWPSIVENNLIYGKMFPEVAKGGQRGSFSSALFHGIRAVLHPMGAVKEAIGKAPDILEQYQQRAAQEAVMGGNSLNTGLAQGLAKKVGGLIDQGSNLVKDTPWARMALPVGVKSALIMHDMDNLHDHNQKIDTLAAMERASNAFDRTVSNTASNILNDKPMEHKPYEALHIIEEQSPTEHSQELKKISNNINELVSNPDLFMDRLSKAIPNVHNHAPMVGSMVNATALRAVQFLQGRLPQMMDAKPLDPEFVPSKNDLIGLAKTFRTINNPLSVMKDVSRGTFGKEQKDVLQSVFPDVYEHMKSKLLEQLINHKAKSGYISFRKRMVLSYFLDQSLDSSSTPQAIQTNQMLFAQNVPPSQGPKMSQMQSKSVDNMKTPMQRIAEG